MGKENKSYRIRTNVDKDTVVNFSVDNTIDNFEILSLNINQANAYKLMGSGTGIIAGRVLANGGFGVPNVKVSVFIEYDGTDKLEQSILYHFTSTKDLDYNGVRYNLLPNEVDDECHQNIGTFPAKRVLLDNDNWIEVFDKYYKFTTRTNESGDYMIYGVPTGMQTVHMDVDLSDIGVLSQRPRDLIYKGYNANMFESPSKFKVDTNIDSLAQVITQDQSVYVYPFWGDTTDSELNASITRCDMNVNYKFEPTCIFMGSVVSDTGENSMSKKCIGAKKQGKMSEMITGEGKIEMIRKTANGQVEQFSINGDNSINSDGVWCYQIPMNLDYVMTDEFGKMVMTDNPNTGIPTRARVRFRLSMAESPNDATARKRARFLIPNNPHLMEEDYPDFTETKEVDYEFGTKTKNENFRDLFWNNVYTVKSYIPRLQKSKLPNNLRHLGIKMVNHSGGHNPMPFNNLRIKFNFVYSFLCTLVKVLVTMVRFINSILSFIGYIFYNIGTLFFKIGKGLNIPIFGENLLEGVSKIFASYNGHAIDDDDITSPLDFAKRVYADTQNNIQTCDGVAAWFFKLFIRIGCGIELRGLCETDDGTEITVTPGTYDKVKPIISQLGMEACNDRVDILYNCVENQLAQDNDVTSFNFYNDWINGVVYLPLWYRRIKKRRNGEIKKDQWCSTDNTIIQDRKYKKNLRLYNTNVPQRTVTPPNGQKMGVINPLVNNENTVSGSADDETGAETIKFSVLNDDNCYGYQCHKYSRSYFKVYKGLVFEKITMLGDKVYYYKPCDYDISTGNSDLVTLFATDIVLLGSLNNCDLHGIPQFFKALESTTYNMPPDLLSEYYDYINENSNTNTDEEDDAQIDLGSRMTEATGSDWGNLGVDQSNKPDANENQYDNGGLFYGLTCFNSYTKPKSCINLARICEFGVSLDESVDVPSNDDTSTESDVNTITPDGFVSYDEIYNPDYRSMFATLNANFLRTKLNTETGLMEYDFNHLYIDNFDGSLRNLMMANTVNGKTEKSEFKQKANYTGNYNLEVSSDAYLNFRYGNYTKRNGNKIYFYENNNYTGSAMPKNGGANVYISGKNRLPRYENSFYFYFGLNEGKTAIDKFNNEFFSDCSNKFASDVPYEMTYLGNSWCPPDTSTDGYIAFNMNIDAPFKIRFTNIDTNNVYEQSSINSQKFIFYGTNTVPEGYEKYDKVTLIKNGETAEYGIMPGNGIYDIEVIDAYDNSYEDRIVFELPRIGFVCDVIPFSCRNSDLQAKFGNVYKKYESGSTIPTNTTYYTITYTRYNVGEVITAGSIYYIKNNNEYIEQTAVVDITVSPENEFYYKEYTSHVANVDITVEADDDYYYKDSIYQYVANYKGNSTDVFDINNRDIDGYITVSEVSEENFKIELTPINGDFFGDAYEGVTVTVIDGDVSTIGAGYLGLTENNGITTYYFGVPYANQRYKVKLTMMCEGGDESNNTREINVIVYEDEFKMYINGIDYDLIKSFKTGWSDNYLIDGKFKQADRGLNQNSEFSVDNLYGWNDVLNIGTYDYDGTTKGLKPISNSTDINEILAICNVLSTTYEHNGTGDASDTTPYSWTEDYCYDAPYLHEGYTIINEPLYDYDGNEVQSGDIIYGVTYYKDDEHTIPAVEGTDYVDTTSDYYTQGTVQRLTYTYQIAAGITLYDINGEVEADDIQHGTTYYKDQSLTEEAVVGIDYYENTNEVEVDIERVISGTQIEYRTITGNILVATEDENGIITMIQPTNPNVEYNTLVCMPLSTYSMIIDNINAVINNRAEFSRQVGGAFRINDGETMLSLATTTKSRPVKYLIAGSGEIIDASGLYNYRPNTSSPTRQPINGSNNNDSNTNDNSSTLPVTIIDSFDRLDNTTFNGLNNINIITDGYVVDQSYETPSVTFTLPTLSIGNKYEEYIDNYIYYVGAKYYTKHQNVYVEHVFDISTDRNRVGEFKTAKQITTPIYQKLKDFNKFEPYATNDNKHPYYVSVKNNSDNLIPITDDTSNFNTTSSNKKLTTTFGVHFYDKPLTGEFPFILSAINNIPTYPNVPLGGNNVTGWYRTIRQSSYRILEDDGVKYVDDGESIPQGTTILYLSVDNPDEVPDTIYEYTTDVAKTVEQIKQEIGATQLYKVNSLIKYPDNSTTVVYNGYVIYHKTNNYYSKLVIEGYGNGGTMVRDFAHGATLYHLAPFGAITIQCVNIKYGNENRYFDVNVDGCAVANANNYNAKIIDGVCTYNNIKKQNTSLGNTVNSVDLIKSTDISGYYTYAEEEGNYDYHEGTPGQEVKAFGIYKFGGNIIYYGDYNDSSVILANWKPIDVLMPGFISGYLYNGIPADSNRSNIKAYFSDNEIELYTDSAASQDVYGNNKVKRLIYTEYSDRNKSRYGTYKLDSVDKQYQYAELPLVNDYLTYTDGYGIDYQYQIDATFNVQYEYPIITYINFKSGDVDTKYDDYLITKTYYTNDKGYLRHQTLYYIFDLDKTDYPFMYFSGSNPESGEESNLVYDEDTNSFRLKTMPEVFKNIDNVEISHYISKSKSTHFNISNYIRTKYQNSQPDFDLKSVTDKFFTIACCNNQYTISPIIEIQTIRVIYNYNNFDNTGEGDHSYVYITSRNKRGMAGLLDMHYVEDFYYLNYYRFIIKVASYDIDENEYISEMYTQVCSVAENTAEKCYIKVEDRGSQPSTYCASAIRVKMSSLGKEATNNDGKTILPWLHILISDKTRVVRKTISQTGNVTITVYNSYKDMVSQNSNQNTTNTEQN